MRRGVTVVMVLGILADTIGLSAQSAGRTPTASPFSRDAIDRAIAAARASIAVPRAGQGKADWRRVQERRLGSEIYLVLNSGVSGTRVLVESNDTGLTVLNLDRALPLDVTKILGDLARSDPQRLLAISRSGSWSNAATKISLTPDGVLVAGQKVSEWSSLINRIDKADVVEVRTGKPGGVGRAFAGALLGLVGGTAVAAVFSDDDTDSSAIYLGQAIGAVAGAIFFPRITRDAWGLIYRR